MVYIYTASENTKRLNYISQHIFNNLLGVQFVITTDKKKYLAQSDSCINYSTFDLGHGIQIIPNGLLFESGVRKIKNLKESEWKGFFCFFHNGNGTIPFDLFAAAFYLLTLYEEYFPAELDEHGRFSHTESILFKKNCLEIPIIDRWAYLLKEELEKAGFHTGNFQLRKFKTVSTYDLDHPFLYQYKGWIKNSAGIIRDLFRSNFGKIKERILTQLRLRNDPYMTAIQAIHEIQKQLNRPYYLFVLLGKKGKYRQSTFYTPQKYFSYLKKLNAAQIGLHPSYDTLRNVESLMREKAELEVILGHQIIASRQHFLRMQNPETFQELTIAGIKEDFTLAFAKAPGFRSGTAVPYLFYDLQKEEITSLLIRPTIMMDSTFIFHLKLTPEEALAKMEKLIDACKQSGGDYVSLWHNSNLAYTPQQNPWISVFIQSYKYAISLENH